MNRVLMLQLFAQYYFTFIHIVSSDFQCHSLRCKKVNYWNLISPVLSCQVYAQWFQRLCYFCCWDRNPEEKSYWRSSHQYSGVISQQWPSSTGCSGIPI